MGVANLRGSVLPIASARELLNKPAAADLADARAIVLDAGAPVALVVDAVATLEAADAENIETHKNEVSAEGAEQLVGTFSFGADKTVAKILDIKAMLAAAFVNRERRSQRTHVVASAVGSLAEADQGQDGEALVTFDVAGQEFALPLGVVREILPLPATITAVARAESVVLGITAVRDSLLPLLSLRSLLGFAPANDAEQREKIVVMNVAGTQVGLVADRARSVVAADLALVDPVPPVLAARTGGESRIKSIYRSDAGRRLISILAPENLFREDVMQRLVAGQQALAQAASPEESDQAEVIFVVFRLGGDEFGLPIESVVEVAEVPPQITRVPKAPKFIEGVINLRGEVLPVVDQRRRFDLPKLDAATGRRLVVLKTERHRAGLIVDGVSDVLRVQPKNIEPPPDLTDATTRLVRGVVNLEGSKRIVLVLDPTEVLTRAERTQLDTFQAAGKKANA